MPGAMAPMIGAPEAVAPSLVAQRRRRDATRARRRTSAVAAGGRGARLSIRFELSLRGRAVDAEADGAPAASSSGAAAGGEDHVRGRAMAHRRPVPAEPGDLVVVEMDAVRQPDPVVEPAALLEIVDRPAAEGARGTTPPRRSSRRDGCAAGSQALGEAEPSRIRRLVTENGEQGARAICSIAPSAAIVVAAEHPLAVGQDRVLVLDHAASAAGRPSSGARLMLPRVSGQADAELAASSTSMSIASSRPRRKR